MKQRGFPSVSPRVLNEKNEILKSQTAKNTPSTREVRIATIELIRKLELKSNGGKDVFKFVDRLEELGAIYEVDLNSVVPVMCVLLKDHALIPLGIIKSQENCGHSSGKTF